MHSRWTSRKFLTTLAAQIAALVVLFWPEQREAVVAAAESIAALAVVLLSGLGYVVTEGAIDRAERGGTPGDDRA